MTLFIDDTRRDIYYRFQECTTSGVETEESVCDEILSLDAIGSRGSVGASTCPVTANQG